MKLQNVQHAIRPFMDKVTRSVWRSCREDSEVEVITDREVLSRCYQQLLRSAREDVQCMVRHPSVMWSPTSAEEIRGETHGCRVYRRNVIHPDVLETRATTHRVESAPFDDTRISSRAAFNMLVTDKRIGLLSFDPERPDSAVLLVRSSALLAGFLGLFHSTWEQAAAMRFGVSAAASTPEDCGIPCDAQALIPWLVAGLNDKAIAHELGISVRTLMRRVASLLSALDARSRFQAGWRAALRLNGMSTPVDLSDSGAIGPASRRSHVLREGLEAEVGTSRHGGPPS